LLRRAQAVFGWPLLAGFLRMFVGLAAGWFALRLTGSLTALFLALGLECSCTAFW